MNIEGFAIAPDSTCVDGVKEVVWSDDGISAAGHEGHALYSGTFPCGLDLDLDQTIDFPALPNTSPIGTVTLHATASSGLPVSYSSTTPTICTVSGSVVTPTAAGTCTIEATQGGNADYNPAPPVSQSFTVECQTLCLLNPSAAGSLRAEGSARVNAGGGDVFVNSNASAAATLSGSAKVSAAYIGGPSGGFTKTGSGSYSPTPKLSAPSVDPLAGLAACPDLSGACPTGAPNPPVKVGGASRVHDRPGRVPLARGRRQRQADPPAGRVRDHRPGVGGGGRPPHRQRRHAVPRVHELPDTVLGCRSIAERGRQWRGRPDRALHGTVRRVQRRRRSGRHVHVHLLGQWLVDLRSDLRQGRPLRARPAAPRSGLHGSWPTRSSSPEPAA